MKTLQQVIDERHEVSNALFKARSKAMRSKLKIQKEIDEKEQMNKFAIWLCIGVMFIVGVFVLASIETDRNMKDCLEKNSQDYCEQTLGGR